MILPEEELQQVRKRLARYDRWMIYLLWLIIACNSVALFAMFMGHG